MSERRGGYCCPQMRSPAGSGESGRAKQKSIKSTNDISDTPLELQAHKLRRLFAFAPTTALLVASLAYAGDQR